MIKFLIHWRQVWRIAEMRLLFLALLVSVIAITAVGFFTDRADKAMSSQATQIMGGDLVLSSSRPIDKHYIEHAKQLGLKFAEVISFPSMVSFGDKMQLAQIKAISKNYPLTGELETSNGLSGIAEIAKMTSLNDNKVWAESRLFVALGVQTNAIVQLGKRHVQLSKLITKMPDQGVSAFQFAPKLLMPLNQLDSTGLLTPASRASFSQLYVGNSAAINQFKIWLKPQLKVSERIRTLEDGLPSIEQALNRGKRFLSLAALLSVILAGAAIALTSYSLNQRETRTVAVLKTIGASRRVIMQRYVSQLLFAATLAGILGAVIGYIIQAVIVYFLQTSLGQVLPSAGFMPVITGFFTAYIMALGFSAPQLLQLMNVAPIHILQGKKPSSNTPYRYAFIAILAGTLLLMWMQTHDLKLSVFLLLGTVIATLLFWLSSQLLLKLLRQINRKIRRSSSLSLPKANPRIALLIVVFGIGLFSLLLLTALRTDLIDRWQETLPKDAPNHFLINIQANEVEPIKAIFSTHNMTATLYPMIRGRLIAINDKPVSAQDYSANQAKRLLSREFNMSSVQDLPDNNKVVNGQWFDTAASKGLSVEQGIAKTLKLKMGDQLSFNIAGQTFIDTITSLRSVRWDSMKPNFFVLGAPTALDNYPRTYITSVHVSETDKHFIPKLISQYPSVTDIDISSIMGQIKDLINKAAFAVQAIFSFTLIAGIIVLFAALQSQKAERRREIAILKSIGASRKYLRNSLIMEFTIIGAIAGFIAGILAIIAANVAAYSLFDLNPSVNISLLILGVGVGATLVGAAGYLNMRHLLNVTPVALFQE
ncbi:MAG TPA: FtsX-like permease family protein [Leucothrix mucor]|nr:FtsX-like permease family protein [Leucothrix mucor]